MGFCLTTPQLGSRVHLPADTGFRAPTCHFRQHSSRRSSSVCHAIPTQTNSLAPAKLAPARDVQASSYEAADPAVDPATFVADRGVAIVTTLEPLREILSVLAVPYNAYSRALVERPLITKACTACVGFMLGDMIAQSLAHPDHINLLRMGRLGLYGLLVDGPVGSIWYDILDAKVEPENPTSTKAVVVKTTLDQLVYATVMTAVYFTFIKLIEGHPEQIYPVLEAKFLPTLAANYLVWPLAHLINFKFVPTNWRILYNNAVCVAWLCYVSFATHPHAHAGRSIYFKYH